MVWRWYDAHARDYDATYSTRVHAAENLAIAKALNTEPVHSVVDIGCGTGLAYQLLEFPFLADSWYYGVDPSEGMLREAEFKYPPGGVQHRQWIQSEAGPVLRSLSGLDLVCSLFAFQWVPDPEHVLMLARRALRPGGRLVVVSARRRVDPAPFPQANYRARDWRYLLRAWEDVAVRPLTPWKRLARVLPSAVEMPGPADLGQYLIVEAKRGGGRERYAGGAGERERVAHPVAVQGPQRAQDPRRGEE